MELARRFYLSNQTQVEISRITGLDPSTVSRYLRRAREIGMVKVEIQRPRNLRGELAQLLAQHFHLRRAVVVEGLGGVPQAAADLVGSRLLNGMRLGLSWGRTLAASIRLLRPGSVSHLEVTLLHGGVGRAGAGAAIQGHELARHVASLYPYSHVNYLQAPVLVDSPDIKQAMMRDASIKSALGLAASCEVALVGVGNLSDAAPLVRYGHLAPAVRDKLLAAGAVGDVATHFFTINGKPIDFLDGRLIAIEWQELETIPTVIAIAAGAAKRAAILGALRSGLIDEFITDEETARMVVT
jgi:DNA-binding transcriptional regulator LsrR (DeoR family)